jgi:hypothetical protein
MNQHLSAEQISAWVIGERTSVTRMNIPLAALVAAGFTVRGVDPGATLTADVLVGQDGRAHAVRLTSNRSVIQ